MNITRIEEFYLALFFGIYFDNFADLVHIGVITNPKIRLRDNIIRTQIGNGAHIVEGYGLTFLYLHWFV